MTPRFIRAGAMKKLHACSMQGGHGHHHHTHGHADAACYRWQEVGEGGVVAVGSGNWWRLGLLLASAESKGSGLWSRNTGERGLSPVSLPHASTSVTVVSLHSSFMRERESPVIDLLLTINRARHLGPFHLHFHSSTS